jgi:hypothetical protein
MAKGFAGAARLDERRRRRLAAEGDSSANPAPENSTSQSLPAKNGGRRLLHRTAVADSATLAGEPLPLAAIIPAARWRHVVQAVLAFGGAAFWLSLVHGEESIAAALQPATAQALKSVGQGGGVWYAAMLLAACAPLSLLIGWARSHSVRDFTGRYRVWTPVAGVWVLFSFCLSAGVAHPWSTWVNSFLPGDMPQRPFLVWFVPVAVVGLWAAFAVGREVWGNRTSFWILTAAGAFWLGSASLSLKIPLVSELPLQDLWRDIAAALGPVLLFVGLSFHARHVIHCNLDPSPSTGWSKWLPRPHLWPGANPRAASQTEPTASSASRSTRSRRTRSRTARKTSARSRSSTRGDRLTASDLRGNDVPRRQEPESNENETGRDSSPAAVSNSQPAAANRSPSSATAASADVSHAVKPTPFTASVSSVASNTTAPVRGPQPQQQPEPSLRVNAPHAPAHSDEEEADSRQPDSSGEWDEGFADRNQDFRGLSRKERKRLLREQRNRGHNDRR